MLEDVVQQESVEDSCLELVREQIVKKIEEALKEALEALQQNPLKNFKGCILSGSLAKGTAIKVEFDIDIVAFFRQGSHTAKDRVNHFTSQLRKCVQLWKRQGLVASSEVLRNTAKGVKLYWLHAGSVQPVDLVVALEPAPASTGPLLSSSNTFVFGPTIQDECSRFISKQPQVVKDCVKLMKLYAVYEQQMSNNISPGGHQFRFPPGCEDSLDGPITIEHPVPAQVLQPFTRQNLTHKLDADHWKYFREACIRAQHQFAGLANFLRLSTCLESQTFQDCDSWLASFQSSMREIPPMFAANTVTNLPPDAIDDRCRPSIWGSLASYLHVPLLWAAEQDIFGKGFTQGSTHREASHHFWKAATEYWFLEELALTDGKPRVSKLSITGPSATSVQAAYKMLVYEAHQRCKAAGFYPVRPNIARAVALLFHEVVWNQVREKNNATHVDLQDPSNLVRKKELESQRLDEVMACFGVQLEMHEPPMRKGRLWQGEPAKLHRMCQAVATFVDMSNDAVLAVVGPCTFSSQGAKNWAFCWMLEALFEVGQASIPDAVLDRMGLAKDDPTIVAMPKNLPQWWLGFGRMALAAPKVAKVHEEDLVANYEILKEFLLAFAGCKLPSAEDQKAAFALLAVTCNLYPSKLYEKKGGKKEVKD
eukprot:s261_g2.t1